MCKQIINAYRQSSETKLCQVKRNYNATEYNKRKTQLGNTLLQLNYTFAMVAFAVKTVFNFILCIVD